jgi:hypothetical protein
LGLLSLMVADSIKHVIHALIMVWLLRRQLGGLGGYHIVSSAIKSLVAAVASGLAANAAAIGLATLLAPNSLASNLLAHNLFVVGGAGATGLLIYVAVAWALNGQEVRALTHLVRQRIRMNP